MRTFFETDDGHRIGWSMNPEDRPAQPLRPDSKTWLFLFCWQTGWRRPRVAENAYFFVCGEDIYLSQMGFHYLAYSEATHLRPMGMWDLWVEARSRDEAVRVLKRSPVLDEIDHEGYFALVTGESFSFMDIDLATLEVRDFKPAERTRDAKNLYVAAVEYGPDVPIQLPSGESMFKARSERNEEQARRIRRETPNAQKTFADLDERHQKLLHVRDDGCWIWTGAHTRGYGNVSYCGKRWSSHCLIYTLLRGKIPHGAIMRHSCDVRLCCNPDHLTPGTHQENRQDSIGKGRKLNDWRWVSEVSNSVIREIRLQHYVEDWSVRKIARRYELNSGYVRAIVNFVDGSCNPSNTE